MSEPEPPRTVAVRFERVAGWIDRYDDRHPGTVWAYEAERVRATSPDGSSAAFDPPFRPLDDPSPTGLTAHLARPWRLGVVIVRKGGFAVAHVVGDAIVASKVGQRHVQSRSKAGGWSQQRFARRRDNQARAAYDAASGHVHEIVLPHAGQLDLLVLAGDRAAVDAVFDLGALAPLLEVRRRWIAGVSDPKRAVLDQTVAAARSVEIAVIDTIS